MRACGRVVQSWWLVAVVADGPSLPAFCSTAMASTTAQEYRSMKTDEQGMQCCIVMGFVVLACVHRVNVKGTVVR